MDNDRRLAEAGHQGAIVPTGDGLPPTQPSSLPDDIKQPASFAHSDSEDGDDERHVGVPIESGVAGDVQPQSGVSKAQAFNRYLYESGPSGRILLYVLCVSLGLTMFAYALDQGITSTQFPLIVASYFSTHSSVGSVGIASQIISAISKPFLSKISDITSRPTTYLLILIFYTVGYIVAASCTTFASYIIGVCFTSFGKSGLDLLSDIIVADLTTLEWRGFMGSLLTTPFLVTTFIDGEISEKFIPDGWRWGLGMFAIIVPVLLTPTIASLYIMQHKAKKAGMVSAGDSGMKRKGELDQNGTISWPKVIRQAIIDIDLIGLLLLGFAFALILLPFSLAPSANGKWSNPSMIAMIVVGFVILFAFGICEMFVSPKPLLTRRIIKNRGFTAAVGVDVCTQMASGLRTVYFASYIWIITDWSNYAWTIFLATVTLGLCFIGPVAGLIQRKTHRYKTLMVIGCVLKLIANGILLAGHGSNRATTNTAALVVSQVMFSFGAFTVVGARVGSQASVPHEDMATVISNLALWSTLGSSVGYAITSAIWSNLMLGYLGENLPASTPTKTVNTLYKSIKTLRAYPFESPIRQGAIVAYSRVMGIIFIVSTIVAAASLCFSLLMPNYYLGKQQNAVTNTGPDGRPLAEPVLAHVRDNEKPENFWQKIVYLYYK